MKKYIKVEFEEMMLIKNSAAMLDRRLEIVELHLEATRELLNRLEENPVSPVGPV